MPQVSHVVCENIALNGTRGSHLGLHFRHTNVGSHKWPFKLPVNFMLRGVPVWVRTAPAVVLDSGVERLGCISDVVPEPADVKDGRIFYGMSILVFGRKSTVFTKRRFETLPDLVASQGCRPTFSGR